jgi:hypothetical protein
MYRFSGSASIQSYSIFSHRTYPVNSSSATGLVKQQPITLVSAHDVTTPWKPTTEKITIALFSQINVYFDLIASIIDARVLKR